MKSVTREIVENYHKALAKETEILKYDKNNNQLEYYLQGGDSLHNISHALWMRIFN